MLKQKTRNVEIIKSNTTVEREHLLYFKILIFITNTKFMDIPISKSQTVSIGLKKKKRCFKSPQVQWRNRYCHIILILIFLNRQILYQKVYTPLQTFTGNMCILVYLLEAMSM